MSFGNNVRDPEDLVYRAQDAAALFEARSQAEQVDEIYNVIPKKKRSTAMAAGVRVSGAVSGNTETADDARREALSEKLVALRSEMGDGKINAAWRKKVAAKTAGKEIVFNRWDMGMNLGK